ncbi:MAG: lysylphosphatidylglycerol synthase domain-containing protein, partial [Anaerolineae bacterium]
MCAIDRAVVYWIGFTVFCARYDGEMSADKAKQKRNRILSWAINLAGVLAFVFILYLGGVEAWEQIVEGDWRYVLAALAVTLLWNLVAAFRWALIADQVAGVKVCAFRYYFTYQMIGMLTGQVVPITVGMIGARPVALSLSQQLSLRRSGLSVFLDKSFDLILALLLVTPVALFLIGWIELPLACWLIGGVVVAG